VLFYHRQGSVPPKRYTVLRGGPDGIYHEELLSTEGFTGASSTLYRLHPPTRITRVEELAVPEQKTYQGPADNMLFRPDRIAASGDIYSARVPLFANADVTYSVCRPDAATDGFYRNGSSDEVMFVVAGSGRVQTAFGDLDYRERDLVVGGGGRRGGARPGRRPGTAVPAASCSTARRTTSATSARPGCPTRWMRPGSSAC
jgi:homogentisate 1,2-dioxygenase